MCSNRPLGTNEMSSPNTDEMNDHDNGAVYLILID